MTFANAARADESYFGCSKIDITPTEPIRLSGYGSRREPSVGVDSRLFVRVLAFGSESSTDKPKVERILVSIESIGFPGSFTNEIFLEVASKYSVKREDFVLCFTHDHTAPHIDNGLSNLFSGPIPSAHQRVLEAYTASLKTKTLEAVQRAVEDLQPGRMLVAQGTATFARNRRVLKDGVWTGFGEQADGPVDHSLPVIRITDLTGKKTRAIVFNYACHCTTFGGEYNRVNGDWAGYAAEYLEAEYSGATALCTIGCGADANPARDSGRALELAQAQGREICTEVSRLMEEARWKEINVQPAQSGYGFAGLPIQRPTQQDLQEALKDSRFQVRRHAEKMLELEQKMGRLPETYPMPIQAWRFCTADDKTNDFVMLFLGGEVCVDYALRVKAEIVAKSKSGELGTDELSAADVWVSAYANDVFGYVAPEKMQSEGGYEVDYSMIYYLQPGRWASGTEEVIMRRIHELTRPAQKSSEVDELGFQVSDGYEVRLLASEPVIRDPINMVVDARGQLWVVEMGDYPSGDPKAVEPGAIFRNERAYRGTDQKPWDGEPGGRVKLLRDSDGDGVYEDATVFLDNLTFPTGVFPWEDGLLVCAAPNVLLAWDTDGDGTADKQKVLYTGFEEANPQHRVNGFEWGLDGWLYLAAGNHDNGQVTSLVTGETVETSGRDIRIEPATGRIEVVSGASQWCRARDDCGNWYGNDNTRPLFQFVLEERFLNRNPFVASPTPRQDLTNPPRSPEVFPVSRTVDRFNDLHTLNRFTSACSPTIRRDVISGDEQGALEAFVCEPVHNLVSRLAIDRGDFPFAAERLAQDTESEFLASTDNWFRPVRVITPPNRDVMWVCDMYRQVVEHPEWIPESWQASLDLYAGSDKGRIYAVSQKGTAPNAVADLQSMTSPQITEQLQGRNGWVRDTAQRLLMERSRSGALEPGVVRAIRRLANHSAQVTAVRIQAMWTLAAVAPQELQCAEWCLSPNSNVVCNALRIMELHAAQLPEATWQKLVAHRNPQVRFEAALALGGLALHQKSELLGVFETLFAENAGDSYLRAAAMSSVVGVADQILVRLAANGLLAGRGEEVVNGLVRSALADQPKERAERILESLGAGFGGQLDSSVDIPAADQCGAELLVLKQLSRQGINVTQFLLESDAESAWGKLRSRIAAIGAAVESTEAEQASPQLRAEHLQLLRYAEAENGGSKLAQSLRKFLSSRFQASMQLAAAQTLADREQVEMVVGSLGKVTPSVRAGFENIILSRTQWTETLLAGFESGSVELLWISPATQQALADHRQNRIRERFQEFKPASVHSVGRDDLVAKYREALQSEGLHNVASEVETAEKVASGRSLFKQHCSACHRLDGVGQDVGPQLSSLVGKDSDYLLTAILDPNRAVESKYRAYSVLTDDDRLITGMIAEESATSLRLARSDGTQVSLLRSEIAEMRPTDRSPMPEGFESALSSSQMSDLLAYIDHARSAKPAAAQ
ncbi:MAG: neutral/alkaline non-lysosomal ceramidase N-terminal domain-containing protein [Pirellulaceae bacterium]